MHHTLNHTLLFVNTFQKFKRNIFNWPSLHLTLDNMFSSEKLCLKWNDFQDNVQAAFSSLRNDSELTDVTLACEDGQQVEAHKVILAASSPFFHEVLKKNKHPHPLVFMRGVKLENMVAIVDFLYHGEANVEQDHLDAFLALAQDLKLKGLTNDKSNAAESFKSKVEVELKVDTGEIGQNDQKRFAKMESQAKTLETSVALPDQAIVNDLKDLDEKIRSMMRTSEQRGNQGRLKGCTVCGKEGTYKNIQDHIEAHHITGVSHSCKICGKIFRSRHSLRNHMSSIHK